MVFITEELIRKRAEHNEREIYSLEEISLHQQDIERIEYIDKWCRELKILYLQSNLIPKIENVNRLKKLEYLNLALNNIEIIENLEGCESLKKLDLTVNFVGVLTSVDTLRSLTFLEEMYLTGNPCTEYENYRDYVIATLPQLKRLDGIEITKTERIIAQQNYPHIKKEILRQQEKWHESRKQDKKDSELRKEKRRECGQDNNSDNKEFWDEKVPFTPESRKEVHDYMQDQRRREESKTEDVPKPERRFFRNDGTPFHVNEPKIDIENIHWTGVEDDNEPNLTVDIPVYRFLDTSLLDCDVQPNYIRVTIKGKILQLVLSEEIRPDSSKAERSQTTGHLVLTMPKARDIVPAKKITASESKKTVKCVATKNESSVEKLEVDDSGLVRLDNIVQQEQKISMPLDSKLRHMNDKYKCVPEKPVSLNFQDDPDVPPLM